MIPRQRPSLLEREPVDIEQPAWRRLEVRNDRQRQERDPDKRLRQLAAQAPRRCEQLFQPVRHRLERLQADQPGERQGELGDDRAEAGLAPDELNASNDG